MREGTRQIVDTVLRQDSTVKDSERDSALRVLCGETPLLPLLLTQIEIAKNLGVSRGTVWRWKKEGRLTPVELPDGMVRYRRADLFKLAGLDEEGRAA